MRRGVPLICLLLLAASACSGDGPYVVVSGGGILFNYRLAEATAGIVAEVARPLPDGGKVVAEFEDPAGGPAIVETRAITNARRRFSFMTPPLTGIKADRDYRVVVRVIDAEGQVLQTVESKVHSDLDQSILPDAPLTIGPGYTRNPATLKN